MGYEASPDTQVHKLLLFVLETGSDRFFYLSSLYFVWEFDISMKFLLGKKLGMTTIPDPERGAQNVTLIECDPNTVTLLRTKDRDGYNAVQLSLLKTPRRTVFREFRTESGEEITVNTVIGVESFSVGDRVRVSGISKAKGFQGVVKRHGFKGAPKTHGHKHDLRAPGSIGSTFPEHVIKGKRMAGRMGGVRATSRNLLVSLVDADRKLLGVRGAVPGIPGGIVEIALVA